MKSSSLTETVEGEHKVGEEVQVGEMDREADMA